MFVLSDVDIHIVLYVVITSLFENRADDIQVW